MTPTVDFTLSDEIEELRRSAARFAERDLAPRARSAEADGRWPASVLDVLAGFSLGGLDVAARLGGAQASSLAKVVVLEALASGDAGGLPAADQPGPASGALEVCPEGSVAAEVAASCLAGEAQCALAVVDAEVAGPARLEWTPAWPPLRWAFVSRGDELGLVEVDGDLEPAPALGFGASGGASVVLDGHREVGRWQLAPGGGLTVRGRARLWAAAVVAGVADAALDATIAYTTERVVFGKPVAHHQGNAFELAVAATRLHGARLVVRDAAARFDGRDQWAGFWATQAWLESMDTAFVITDLGIQLLGGHGFLVDHLAEKRFREARMLASLWGGRDAAMTDAAEAVLDVRDEVFDGPVGERAR